MSAGFWSMGGYAGFVWPCFGLAFAILAWNVWSAVRFQADARQRVRRTIAMSVEQS